MSSAKKKGGSTKGYNPSVKPYWPETPRRNWATVGTLSLWDEANPSLLVGCQTKKKTNDRQNVRLWLPTQAAADIINKILSEYTTGRAVIEDQAVRKGKAMNYKGVPELFRKSVIYLEFVLQHQQYNLRAMKKSPEGDAPSLLKETDLVPELKVLGEIWEKRRLASEAGDDPNVHGWDYGARRLATGDESDEGPEEVTSVMNDVKVGGATGLAIDEGLDVRITGDADGQTDTTRKAVSAREVAEAGVNEELGRGDEDQDSEAPLGEQANEVTTQQHRGKDRLARLSAKIKALEGDSGYKDPSKWLSFVEEVRSLDGVPMRDDGRGLDSFERGIASAKTIQRWLEVCSSPDALANYKRADELAPGHGYVERISKATPDALEAIKKEIERMERVVQA